MFLFSFLLWQFYVSLAGILSIGLAILFSYGIALGFGLIYGPIHALMPFLLLGKSQQALQGLYSPTILKKIFCLLLQDLQVGM